MIVGVIGDTHLPFTHKDYRDFCRDTFNKYNVDKVVHIGDLVDHHGISFHESCPDGLSAGDEVSIVENLLIPWIEDFPEMTITLGNHDRLIERRAYQVGLSGRMITPLQQLYDFPSTWNAVDEVVIDGVLYLHGEGSGGDNSRKTYFTRRGCSVVVGHTHTSAGVDIYQQQFTTNFCMNVGCGIDEKSYAFAYARNFVKKPILSCGIVVNGKYGFNVVMEV